MKHLIGRWYLIVHQALLNYQRPFFANIRIGQATAVHTASSQVRLKTTQGTRWIYAHQIRPYPLPANLRKPAPVIDGRGNIPPGSMNAGRCAIVRFPVVIHDQINQAIYWRAFFNPGRNTWVTQSQGHMLMPLPSGRQLFVPLAGEGDTPSRLLTQIRDLNELINNNYRHRVNIIKARQALSRDFALASIDDPAYCRDRHLDHWRQRLADGVPFVSKSQKQQLAQLIK